MIESAAAPGSSRSFTNTTKEKHSFYYPSLSHTAYVSQVWLHFKLIYSMRYSEKAQKRLDYIEEKYQF